MCVQKNTSNDHELRHFIYTAKVILLYDMNSSTSEFVSQKVETAGIINFEITRYILN